MQWTGDTCTTYNMLENVAHTLKVIRSLAHKDGGVQKIPMVYTNKQFALEIGALDCI